MAIRFLAPITQVRHYAAPPVKSKKVLDKPKSGSSNPQKNKKKGEPDKKKKKARTTYLQYDQRDLETFSLCDAMRYGLYSYGE
jgi:large subunit ribosomal protein L1